MLPEVISELFSDTQPAMEALQLDLLRHTPPYRKLEMLAELNNSARFLALIGLRSRYPYESEAKLHRRLAGMLLGECLAHKVYGELSDIT